MSLKNKKILITGGPTWVAIDPVRVISNTATGETGITLARTLSDSGARVTLVLGPGERDLHDRKVKVIRFTFFDELKKILAEQLLGQYDVIIHSAAVSDYKPAKIIHSKIKSDKKLWNIQMVRQPKLIDRIKKVSPGSYAIGFKFDPRTTRKALIDSAKKLIESTKVDAVVANTVVNGKYAAFIVRPGGVSGEITNKLSLAKSIAKLIST